MKNTLATRSFRILELSLLAALFSVVWVLSSAVTSATSVKGTPVSPGAGAMFATIVVNSTADVAANDGACTLREAIISANTDTASGGMVGECAAGSGADVISFAGLAAGLQTITLGATVLPAIVTQMTIDGTTKSGFVSGGQPQVVLVCSALDVGLNFSSTTTLTSSNSSVLAMTINGATGTLLGSGILIAPGGASGLAVSGVSVTGCWLGLNAAGTAAAPNDYGVRIGQTTGNTIGGPAVAARNVISGNSTGGVLIQQASNGNQIRGNYIGLASDGNTIIGNTGTDGGILVNNDQSANNLIGPGNVISGNTADGIRFAPGNTNTIFGNIIGLNATGTADRGNLQAGVQAGVGGTATSNNTIGGTTAADRNIISGNDTDGIQLLGTGTNAHILGNYIGTDITGTLAIGNTGRGILVGDARQATEIGSTAAGSGNVISGNSTSGIELAPTTVQGTIIKRNLIGLAAGATNAATTGIPNGSHGININGLVTGTTIGRSEGGASPSADGNLIAFNGGDGISFTTANAATALISENSIFQNTGLGIDFDNNGVTPNDNPDAPGGPNSRTNFPVILSAIQGSITVMGTLQSIANTTFTIEFFRSTVCDPTSFGEGREFIGSTTVTTDAGGAASFNVTFAATPAVTDVITATATRTVAATIDVTSEFSQCRIVRNPALATAAGFEDFTARSYDNGVDLNWRTGFEVSNLGFNLYRDKSGERFRVNRSLIAGSALMLGATARLQAGNSYSWWDLRPSDPSSVYWLEAIDLNGTSEWFGPFRVDPGEGRAPKRSLTRSMTFDEVSASTAAADPSHPLEPVAGIPASNSPNLTQQRALAARQAIKIGVDHEGWYRLTPAQLISQGLSASVNPHRLKLFVDGNEVPILISGEQDGRLDAGDTIDFYGLGLDTSSTTTRTYWLLESEGNGLRIPKLGEQDFSPGPPSAYFTVERKERGVYFSNLANGDQENFFGAVVRNSATDQELVLNHVDTAATGEAEIEVRLQGVTVQPHQVKVALNGTDLTTLSYNGKDQGSAKLKVAHSLLREGSNTVTLEALLGSSDLSLVDRILITYRHTFRADNNRLAITAPGNAKIRLSGFTRNDLRVFDVTNPGSVVEISTTITPETGGFGADVSVGGSGDRRLFALAGDAYVTNANLKSNSPSNLWTQRNKANLFIITRANLIESLAPLCELRRRQGYRVLIADVDNIYDEYSFGHKSVSAIREWLADMYYKSRGMNYVLLFGDGSYDPKNYLGFGDFDLVPSKSIDTAAAETVSDDWFADFDDDGVPEMALGRLTPRTPAEAQAIVAKIVAHENGAKGAGATLVSDANDGFNFTGINERVRALVPAGTKIDSIEVSQMPDAKARLLESLNRGPRLVNYAGHGSVDLWRGNLLTGTEATGLGNMSKWSVYLIMTCLNGYYQSPNTDSLGESLLRSSGGGIAVWASSGFTIPDGQEEMNVAVIKALYGSDRTTIGTAVRTAKRQIEDLDVRRTWILLADPTLTFER